MSYSTQRRLLVITIVTYSSTVRSQPPSYYVTCPLLCKLFLRGTLLWYRQQQQVDPDPPSGVTRCLGKQVKFLAKWPLPPWQKMAAVWIFRLYWYWFSSSRFSARDSLGFVLPWLGWECNTCLGKVPEWWRPYCGNSSCWLLFPYVAWEKSRYFTTQPVFSPQNNVWGGNVRVQTFHTDDVSLPRSG